MSKITEQQRLADRYQRCLVKALLIEYKGPSQGNIPLAKEALKLIRPFNFQNPPPVEILTRCEAMLACAKENKEWSEEEFLKRQEDLRLAAFHDGVQNPG